MLLSSKSRTERESDFRLRGSRRAMLAAMTALPEHPTERRCDEREGNDPQPNPEKMPTPRWGHRRLAQVRHHTIMLCTVANRVRNGRDIFAGGRHRFAL